MPKVEYTTTKGMIQVTGSGFQTGHLSSMPNGAGTTIADDTNQVDLVAADSGKAFICNLAAQTKVITLPAGCPIGTNYTIIQNAPFTATKNLTLQALSGTDTFAVGSYARAMLVAASGKVAATTHDRLVIANVNTDNSWGVGSLLKATKVAANKWLVEADGNIHGAGKADAYTFNTQ